MQSPDAAEPRRRIFVGDIQGCCDELETLLAAVRFDPAGDRLYTVGDAVNRGPQSAKSVRLLRQLGATMVLGNHEMHWFEVLSGHRSIKGRDTLEDMLRAEDREVMTEWLAGRGFVHLESDVVMVHAGVSPAWRDLEEVERRLRARFTSLWRERQRIDDEGIRFAVSARTCDANGRQPASRMEENDAPFRPWDEHYHGPRIAVFGHWAQRGLVVSRFVRGLDSGCVYGNRLSAWIAEEDRIVQVPARRAYCPTE